MPLDLYLNFDGNCREAVAFYAKTFEQPLPKFMTFGDMPPDPNYTVPEAIKSLVMNTALDIMGTMVMFSDNPPDMPLTVGNNVSLVVDTTDMAQIKTLFGKLSENGKIEMELQETFWSQCYGMLTDQFGIVWQFSHDDGRVM